MDTKQTVRTVRNEAVHNVIMEGRKKISISGVEDIDSFNEEEIILKTSHGVLILRGNGLHINKLSVDSGDTAVTGEINSIEYPENYGKTKGSSLIGRLLR